MVSFCGRVKCFLTLINFLFVERMCVSGKWGVGRDRGEEKRTSKGRREINRDLIWQPP